MQRWAGAPAADSRNQQRLSAGATSQNSGATARDLSQNFALQRSPVPSGLLGYYLEN